MQSVIKFKHFDKYRFIKDFAATASDQSKKEEKEREAEIIANAIEENEQISFDNLATKQDLEVLKNDLENKIEMSKKDLIIKLGGLMATGVGIIAILIKF